MLDASRPSLQSAVAAGNTFAGTADPVARSAPTDEAFERIGVLTLSASPPTMAAMRASASLPARSRPFRCTCGSQLRRAAAGVEWAVIVMGSHGRSGLMRALMGSVATAVSRHGERPVLIVHAAAADRAA